MNRRKSTKFNNMFIWERASQVVRVVKNPPANAWDIRCGFDPWIRKIPWRRAWQLTSVFLPGNPYGQKSLVGYSPWGQRVGHDWSHLTCSTPITLSLTEFFLQWTIKNSSFIRSWNPSVWDQLKDCGFGWVWVPAMWVQVPVWGEQFHFQGSFML